MKKNTFSASCGCDRNQVCAPFARNRLFVPSSVARKCYPLINGQCPPVFIASVYNNCQLSVELSLEGYGCEDGDDAADDPVEVVSLFTSFLTNLFSTPTDLFQPVLGQVLLGGCPAASMFWTCPYLCFLFEVKGDRPGYDGEEDGYEASHEPSELGLHFVVQPVHPAFEFLDVDFQDEHVPLGGQIL